MHASHMDNCIGSRGDEGLVDRQKLAKVGLDIWLALISLTVPQLFLKQRRDAIGDASAIRSPNSVRVV